MNRITICLVALATLALLGCKKEQQVVERVYVIGERVPLHDAPQIRGEARSIVQRGTWLEVLAAGLPDEEHGDKRLWYRVRHEGKELYLSAEEALLRYNIITFRPVSEVGLVIPLQAPYRTNPDLRAAPAGQWKKGEIVSITAEAQLSHAAGQRWLQTKLGDRSGYILATMVERAPSSEREELEKRAALDEYEAADGYLCLTVEKPEIFSDIDARTLASPTDTGCSFLYGEDNPLPTVLPVRGDCLKVVARARHKDINYFRLDQILYAKDMSYANERWYPTSGCSPSIAGWISAGSGDYTEDVLEYRLAKSGLIGQQRVLFRAFAFALRDNSSFPAAAPLPATLKFEDLGALPTGEHVFSVTASFETNGLYTRRLLFTCGPEACRQPPLNVGTDYVSSAIFEGEFYLLTGADVRVMREDTLAVFRGGKFQQIGGGENCTLEPPRFTCAPKKYPNENEPHSFVIENGTLKPVQ